VRLFDSLPRWAPFARDYRLDGALPPDAPGCECFVMRDNGARLRERLVALWDYDFGLILCDSRRAAAAR
jgi:hypothetical protein